MRESSSPLEPPPSEQLLPSSSPSLPPLPSTLLSVPGGDARADNWKLDAAFFHQGWAAAALAVAAKMEAHKDELSMGGTSASASGVEEWRER
jgi:hypothetical protein